MKAKDNFKADIQNFIEKSKSQNSGEQKKAYYDLVKKYHPDLNNNNTETYDKYMMLLNHVYSKLKEGIPHKINKFDDEYEKMKVNGKYAFLNRDNKIETVSDKSLFLYKMGLDKIFWSRDYLCTNPLADGYGDETVTTVSEALYTAIQYLTASLKIGKNKNWVEEAKEKIVWAYEMNNRITKNLYEKEAYKTLVLQ